MASKPKKPTTLRADRRSAPPQKRGGTKKRKRASKPKTGFVRTLVRLILFPFRLLWAMTWRIGAVVTAMLAISVIYTMQTLPEVDDLIDGRARGSVTLLDQNAQVFAWRGEQFGGQVSAQTVSPHLKHAVVATEDKRFYRHLGISPRGIASAVRINMREGRGPLSGNGGSTITQQTAKLLCLGVPFDREKWDSEAAYERDCRRTTIWRKVKEAIYAFALEAKYSKDDVLTVYLNRAFLGAGARGFEAASQRYFGLSAADVNPQQAAMLAGLLKAPSSLAPTRNLDGAQKRASIVVGLMADQGYLTSGEAEFARAKPATLSPAAAAKAGGYFADWAMSTAPEYFTRNTTDDVIIRTTLDPALQKSAEDAVRYIFSERVRDGSKAQAAVVVMSADGAVRGMVGGRASQVNGAFNRATQAKRQTGSTFKPFVFATALELGYSPNDIVIDESVTYNIPGSGAWTPTNYTNDFKGRVSLTDALVQSLNIPAIKLSESVGRDLVRKVATDFGIESDLAQGPALALGASESSLLEMTGAFAGILNGGSSVRPYGIMDLRFQGASEALFGHDSGIGERVIGERAAAELTEMMFQVVERGTGRRASIPGVEIAGKTGTTQAARDAWFIGFTSEYVVGVWMGYDNNTPLKGVTGSGLPAEIWHETMIRIIDGLPPAPLPRAQSTKAPQPQAIQPAPTETPSDDPLLGVLKQIFGGGD